MVVLSDAPERQALEVDAVAGSPLPCAAVVGRQFALWPFAPRMLRLLLLVDPNQTGVDQQGLLRAMQHCCIGSESGSQTNAVRSAINAAHYVLRHHNHEVLPEAQVNAAAIVAAVRSNVAYVALVGNAAAFAWRSGRLTGQRSVTRLGRPLGLDQEPRVVLWSTPLRPGDRLVLACGPTWRDDTDDQVREILAGTPRERLEARLSEALGCARVLVDDGTRQPRPAVQPPAPSLPLPAARRTPTVTRPRPMRWLAPLAPLALLLVTAFATLTPQSQPRHLELRVQAESLLAEARAISDPYDAHQFASSALEAAQRAASLAPNLHADMVDEAARALGEIDRVYPVQPGVAVRLGPTGTSVVDVAVSRDHVYTLDVGDNSVRRFDARAWEQWPTPETLVVRKGAAVGSRFLDTPFAMQYVAGPTPETGVLTVVDRDRLVAQVLPNGSLAARTLPSSAAWQRIAALRGDADGNLYVLDSGAHRLLEYPGAGQRLVDPPSPLIDGRDDLEHVAEVVPLDDIYLRLDNGSVHRLGRDGQEVEFDVWAPDGRLGAVTAIAADQRGGLFLADAARGRIVEVTADGRFVRQLRDPALGGVRQVQTSPDGRRVFGLVATGILAFDVPDFL